MSRIGATISGFQQLLLTQLSRTTQAATASSYRLATGSIVNFPSDNPSAFLQIQLLQQQHSLLSAAQTNVEVAANVGAEAQTTLDELRTQLESIHEQLVLDEDGELTAAQRATSQAAIDDALATVRSLVRTPIQGRRVLDGSINYTFANRNPSQIKNIAVFALRDDTTLSGSVTTAATQATVTYAGGGGSTINSGDATLTLSGQRGSTSIEVTNGESLADVRDRINADSYNTGITAAVAGNNLVFTTVDYGTDATLLIDVSSGTFSTAGTTAGTDAVVTINGQSIAANDVSGNRVSFDEPGVHVQIDFQPGFTGAFSSVTVSDDSVARFNLSTRIDDSTVLALPGLFPELLGGVSGVLSDLESGGSYAGLGSNTSQAIRIVEEALDQLAVAEGRVNAFADITVGSAARLLDGLMTDIDTSLDALNEADEETELALLDRYESLASNTAAALAILRQFQSSILDLLQAE